MMLLGAGVGSFTQEPIDNPISGLIGASIGAYVGANLNLKIVPYVGRGGAGIIRPNRMVSDDILREEANRIKRDQDSLYKTYSSMVKRIAPRYTSKNKPTDQSVIDADLLKNKQAASQIIEDTYEVITNGRNIYTDLNIQKDMNPLVDKLDNLLHTVDANGNRVVTFDKIPKDSAMFIKKAMGSIRNNKGSIEGTIVDVKKGQVVGTGANKPKNTTVIESIDNAVERSRKITDHLVNELNYPQAEAQRVVKNLEYFTNGNKVQIEDNKLIIGNKGEKGNTFFLEQYDQYGNRYLEKNGGAYSAPMHNPLTANSRLLNVPPGSNAAIFYTNEQGVVKQFMDEVPLNARMNGFGSLEAAAVSARVTGTSIGENYARFAGQATYIGPTDSVLKSHNVEETLSKSKLTSVAYTLNPRGETANVLMKTNIDGLDIVNDVIQQGVPSNAKYVSDLPYTSNPNNNPFILDLPRPGDITKHNVSLAINADGTGRASLNRDNLGTTHYDDVSEALKRALLDIDPNLNVRGMHSAHTITTMGITDNEADFLGVVHNSGIPTDDGSSIIKGSTTRYLGSQRSQSVTIKNIAEQGEEPRYAVQGVMEEILKTDTYRGPIDSSIAVALNKEGRSIHASQQINRVTGYIKQVDPETGDINVHISGEFSQRGQPLVKLHGMAKSEAKVVGTYKFNEYMYGLAMKRAGFFTDFMDTFDPVTKDPITYSKINEKFAEMILDDITDYNNNLPSGSKRIPDERFFAISYSKGVTEYLASPDDIKSIIRMNTSERGQKVFRRSTGMMRMVWDKYNLSQVDLLVPGDTSSIPLKFDELKRASSIDLDSIFHSYYGDGNTIPSKIEDSDAGNALKSVLRNFFDDAKTRAAATTIPSESLDIKKAAAMSAYLLMGELESKNVSITGHTLGHAALEIHRRATQSPLVNKLTSALGTPDPDTVRDARLRNIAQGMLQFQEIDHVAKARGAEILLNTGADIISGAGHQVHVSAVHSSGKEIEAIVGKGDVKISWDIVKTLKEAGLKDSEILSIGDVNSGAIHEWGMLESADLKLSNVNDYNRILNERVRMGAAERAEILDMLKSINAADTIEGKEEVFNNYFRNIAGVKNPDISTLDQRILSIDIPDNLEGYLDSKGMNQDRSHPKSIPINLLNTSRSGRYMTEDGATITGEYNKRAYSAVSSLFSAMNDVYITTKGEIEEDNFFNENVMKRYASSMDSFGKYVSNTLESSAFSKEAKVMTAKHGMSGMLVPVGGHEKDLSRAYQMMGTGVTPMFITREKVRELNKTLDADHQLVLDKVSVAGSRHAGANIYGLSYANSQDSVHTLMIKHPGTSAESIISGELFVSDYMDDKYSKSKRGLIGIFLDKVRAATSSSDFDGDAGHLILPGTESANDIFKMYAGMQLHTDAENEYLSALSNKAAKKTALTEVMGGQMTDVLDKISSQGRARAGVKTHSPAATELSKLLQTSINLEMAEQLKGVTNDAARSDIVRRHSLASHTVGNLVESVLKQAGSNAGSDMVKDINFQREEMRAMRGRDHEKFIADRLIQEIDDIYGAGFASMGQDAKSVQADMYSILTNSIHNRLSDAEKLPRQLNPTGKRSKSIPSQGTIEPYTDNYSDPNGAPTSTGRKQATSSIPQGGPPLYDARDKNVSTIINEEIIEPARGMKHVLSETLKNNKGILAIGAGGLVATSIFINQETPEFNKELVGPMARERKTLPPIMDDKSYITQPRRQTGQSINAYASPADTFSNPFNNRNINNILYGDRVDRPNIRYEQSSGTY